MVDAILNSKDPKSGINGFGSMQNLNSAALPGQRARSRPTNGLDSRASVSSPSQKAAATNGHASASSTKSNGFGKMTTDTEEDDTAGIDFILKSSTANSQLQVRKGPRKYASNGRKSCEYCF